MAVKQADEEAVARDIAPGGVVPRERHNDLDRHRQVVCNIIHMLHMLTFFCIRISIILQILLSIYYLLFYLLSIILHILLSIILLSILLPSSTCPSSH